MYLTTFPGGRQNEAHNCLLLRKHCNILLLLTVSRAVKCSMNFCLVIEFSLPALTDEKSSLFAPNKVKIIPRTYARYEMIGVTIIIPYQKKKKKKNASRIIVLLKTIKNCH